MDKVDWAHKPKKKEKLENLWLLSKSLFMYFQINNGNNKVSMDFILNILYVAVLFLKANIYKIP